jgi:hypothetical protein
VRSIPCIVLRPHPDPSRDCRPGKMSAFYFALACIRMTVRAHQRQGQHPTWIFCAARTCLECGRPKSPGAGARNGALGESTRGPAGVHCAGWLVDGGGALAGRRPVRKAAAGANRVAATTSAAESRALAPVLFRACIGGRLRSRT